MSASAKKCISPASRGCGVRLRPPERESGLLHAVSASDAMPVKTKVARVAFRDKKKRGNRAVAVEVNIAPCDVTSACEFRDLRNCRCAQPHRFSQLEEFASQLPMRRQTALLGHSMITQTTMQLI